MEDAHEAVKISLQMALYSIVDMNERDQMLTTNCEIITKWSDIFLTWDPEKYNNITDTRLPWDRVWTPDIVLYNRQVNKLHKSLDSSKIILVLEMVSKVER